MLKRWELSLSLLLVVCFVSSPVRAQSSQVTISRVLDGDTFETTSGKKVRIIGIDAPEDDPASTDHLNSLIEGQSVTLTSEGDPRDKYGRVLALVTLGDSVDVAALMVEDGYALAYLKYPCSRTDRYLELEIEARKRNVSIGMRQISLLFRPLFRPVLAC